MRWSRHCRLLGLVFVAALLGAQTVLARLLPEFTKLVEANGPAVVNISTTQSSTGGAMRGFSVPDLPEDSPLNDFFQHFFGEGGEGSDAPDDELQSRSLGSGFIMSPDGYVLTNSHVVEGADEVIVKLSDRREFIAQVLGQDPRSDIALLKVDATDLPAVNIGTAKDLKVGEWVLAIGSPFGFDASATAGIVSAKGRNLPSENYVPFIQTDVAINPGNSGGPLFNLDGEVVGINSQIYSRTGGFMGLSFAIPIDMVMDVVQQLKTKGRVTRGWLGVLIQDVTRELAESFGMGQPRGALVAQVLEDSPAETAGVQPGDVIVAFNGTEVHTSAALPPMVGVSPVGVATEIEALRGGSVVKLQVVIGELPEGGDVSEKVSEIEEPTADRLGLVLRDITPVQRKQLGIDNGGVLVQRVEKGAAEKAGLHAGDVILLLDSKIVRDKQQMSEILDQIEPGRSVAVLVQRGDGRLFYPIRVPK